MTCVVIENIVKATPVIFVFKSFHMGPMEYFFVFYQRQLFLVTHRCSNASFELTEHWVRSSNHCRDAPEDLLRNFDYPLLKCFTEAFTEAGVADESHNWFSIPKRKWVEKYHTYGLLIKEGYVYTSCV